MHIMIRTNTEVGERSSLYRMVDLRREAYSVAKGKGRVRDYYVECHDTMTTLRVHVVRKDGIGEMINVAL